jgi:hypothetical protein
MQSNGGIMSFLGPLMGLFGKDPEERINNLNDLATILQGVGKVVKGASKNGLEEKLLPQIVQGGAGAQVPPVEIPSSMNPLLAAKMITEMGFGRR